MTEGNPEERYVGYSVPKQPPSIGNIILSILILIALVIAGYYLYQNFPGSPLNANPNYKNTFEPSTKELSYLVPQFYDNMKFNHQNISYFIDNTCDNKRVQRMKEAFDYLSKQVGYLSFFEKNINPDIEITCSDLKKPAITEDYFVAGEGGATEIIFTERYHIIHGGTIIFHDIKSKQCEWPNVELHELFHVFGFEHSSDKQSIMYPILESCDQSVDSSIINDLKTLYSEENLPDLYFKDVEAVKKGRYLDFKISITNSGSIASENTTISILDSGDEIDSVDLEAINYGAGIILTISNLKLKSRSSDNISFVIDLKNKIKEIDKQNNIANLEF
jgi:hypothetical protein